MKCLVELATSRVGHLRNCELNTLDKAAHIFVLVYLTQRSTCICVLFVYFVLVYSKAKNNCFMVRASDYRLLCERFKQPAMITLRQ